MLGFATSRGPNADQQVLDGPHEAACYRSVRYCRLWAADSAEKDADGVTDQDYPEDKEEDAHHYRVVSDHPVFGVV